MVSLHDLLIHYLEEKIMNNNDPALQEVLNCIIVGGGDQQCVDEFGDDELKIDYEQLKHYYQKNKSSLDDEYNLVCSYAIYKFISDATTNNANNALEIIKEAAESNSVKDFCNNHFDTFLSPNDTTQKEYASALENFAISKCINEKELRKITSMIYAIIKFYRNGSTN